MIAYVASLRKSWVPEVIDRIETLRREAEACTRCRLAEGRNSVVFGVGNPVSSLVLVGEGPGEEEDKQGVPFVGRAGKLLDRALMDNGLNREDVYICNIVKCRACTRKDGRTANRAPLPDEIKSCLPWLKAQLDAIQPKVILCVGGPSAKTLIRPDFSITKQRGIFFDSPYAEAAIATLHPAYILRQMGAKSDGGYSLLVRDVGAAWERACKP
ncbi:MAG: uracil-DNA glycosylase [Armatimonadota bacterium]